MSSRVLLFYLLFFLLVSISYITYYGLPTKVSLETIKRIKRAISVSTADYVTGKSGGELVIHRDVLFMVKSKMRYSGPDGTPSDNYSGMWWMPTNKFVEGWRSPGDNPNLESGSFHVFRFVGGNHIYMTKDWLDFCVEHLSHYFKVAQQTTTFQDHANARQKEYMARINEEGPFSNAHETAFNETIAIIPWYSTNAINPKNVLSSLSLVALASTIASLYQAGARRILVSGNLLHTPIDVIEAFNIFRNSVPTSQLPSSGLALQYVPVFPADRERVNVPSLALEKLHQILKGDATDDAERRRWLGNNTRFDWRYIYFTEPDLILHTRPEAMRSLTRALQQGNLLAGHRLNLLPHEVDFPNNTEKNYYLPSHKNLSRFVDLNIQKGDSCCDAGNWWPGPHDHEKCGNFWYRCGFKRNAIEDPEERLVGHYRMAKYPNMRLADGMNVKAIQEHGRICYPVVGGANCSSYGDLEGILLQ